MNRFFGGFIVFLISVFLLPNAFAQNAKVEIKELWQDDVREEIKKDITSRIHHLRACVRTAEQSFGCSIENSNFESATPNDLKRLFAVFEGYYQLAYQSQEYYLQYGELLFEALALAYSDENWGDDMERDVQKAREALKKLYEAKYCSTKELQEIFKEKYELLRGSMWESMTDKLNQLDSHIEALKKAPLQPKRQPLSVVPFPFAPPAIQQTSLPSSQISAKEIDQALQDIRQRLGSLKLETENIVVQKENNGLAYFLRSQDGGTGKIRFKIRPDSKVYLLWECKGKEDFLQLDFLKMVIQGSGALKVCLGNDSGVCTLFQNSFSFGIGDGAKAIEAVFQNAQKKWEKSQKFFNDYQEAPKELQNAYPQFAVSAKGNFKESLENIKAKIGQYKNSCFYFDLTKTKFNEFASSILINGAPLQIHSFTLTPREVILTGNLVFQVEKWAGLKIELTSLTIGEDGILGDSLASLENLSLGFCDLKEVYLDFSVKVYEGKFGIEVRKARGNIEISGVGGLIVDKLIFTESGQVDGIIFGCQFPQGAKVPIVPGVPIFLKGIFGGTQGLRNPPLQVVAGAQAELADSSVAVINRLELKITFDPGSVVLTVSEIEILKRKLNTTLTLQVSEKGLWGDLQINFPLGILGEIRFEATLAFLKGGNYFLRVYAKANLGQKLKEELKTRVRKTIQTKASWIPAAILDPAIKAIPDIDAELKGLISKGPKVNIEFQGTLNMGGIEIRLFLKIQYVEGDFKVDISASISASKLLEHAAKWIDDAKKATWEAAKELAKKVGQACERFGEKAKNFFRKLRFL